MWWSPKLKGNVHWLPQKVAEGSKFITFPPLFTHGFIVNLDELTKEGESLSFKGSREYWIWSCMVEHRVNTNRTQAKSTTHVQHSKESLDLCSTGVIVLCLSSVSGSMAAFFWGNFFITLFVSSTTLMRSSSVIICLQIESTVSQFFLANSAGPCPVGKSFGALLRAYLGFGVLTNAFRVVHSMCSPWRFDHLNVSSGCSGTAL